MMKYLCLIVTLAASATLIGCASSGNGFQGTTNLTQRPDRGLVPVNMNYQREPAHDLDEPSKSR